jgi:hypothetical protein
MEKADPSKIFPDDRPGDPGQLPSLGDEIQVFSETTGWQFMSVLKLHECPAWTGASGFCLVMNRVTGKYAVAKMIGTRWYWQRSVTEQEAERE